MMTPTPGPGHTRADLDRMPDDGRRYELLEGEIIVNASPSFDHQRMSGGLFYQLRTVCPPGLIVLSAPFDVQVEELSVVVPDLIVVERDRPEQRGLTGAPLLVVEILSPSTRGQDQVRKKRIYERAGVPSYWILDPEVPSLTAWELRAGRFEVAALVAGDEEWVAAAPYEVTLVPARLLD
ncbi:Uma2 family endonuclease [Nocardioides sp. L-11A]|uniref:Uma2 family endonuclease n=1 Tax=Nocardioides sp. L-11A TaxID=3043848 RepID=UPI00249B5695|nr:Uma2 family endonuclease [Nocardioides sp. L-11A]